MRTAKMQPAVSQPFPRTIQQTIPLSISDLTEYLQTRSESERLRFQLSHVTDYTAWFRLSQTIGLLYTVEMTGKLEERGESVTVLTGETRTSLFTYAVIVVLAALTLLTLSSPVAALFGLLCARAVLMLIFCAPDTREELARILGTVA